MMGLAVLGKGQQGSSAFRDLTLGWVVREVGDDVRDLDALGNRMGGDPGQITLVCHAMAIGEQTHHLNDLPTDARCSQVLLTSAGILQNVMQPCRSFRERVSCHSPGDFRTVLDVRRESIPTKLSLVSRFRDLTGQTDLGVV